MKAFCKLAAFALMMAAMTTGIQAQEQSQATVLSNMTEGIGTVTGGNLNWAGYSELVLIPGASLFGTKGSTYLYLGFTSGSTVDVGNMVLYKTARSGSTIISATKITLGGITGPSINLTSTSVCPVQPVSVTNPCFVKLDPIKAALASTDDYYFVIFFTNDSNNQSVGAAGPSNSQGSLSGWDIVGDETRIKAKGTLPSGNNDSSPYFLMYLQND